MGLESELQHTPQLRAEASPHFDLFITMIRPHLLHRIVNKRREDGVVSRGWRLIHRHKGSRDLQIYPFLG